MLDEPLSSSAARAMRFHTTSGTMPRISTKFGDLSYRQQGSTVIINFTVAAPVSGWRMLNASPSSSAPARCSGAAGMLLFCIDRTRPDSTASRNAARSFAGTCQHALMHSSSWKSPRKLLAACYKLCFIIIVYHLLLPEAAHAPSAHSAPPAHATFRLST